MRRVLTATGFLASLFCLSGSAFADSLLFTSGAYSGTVDGWDITGPQYVANNFTVGGQGITSASFVIWADPGDSITTVDWQILTIPGGTVLDSGTAAVSQSLLLPSSIYGYNIDNESFSIPVFTPGAGTYWLQLGNVQGNASPVYWDENDNPNNIPGLSGWDSVVSGGYLTPGNDPGDCPSVACTETFTISGTPEPGSLTLLLAGLAGMLTLAAGLKITRRTSR